MVRKPQILLRTVEVVLHSLLSGISYLSTAALLSIKPEVVFFAVACVSYPLIRTIFDEYTFVRFQASAGKTVLRELAYGAVAGIFIFLPENTSIAGLSLYPLFLTALMVISLLVQPILSKWIYTRIPSFRIQVLFLGPAPLAEHVTGNMNKNNLGHLFHILGYIDYKSANTTIPFLGKLSEMEEILDTIKPQVIINTGRNEQHATLVYTATTRGIQYFSLPHNVQWETFELNHPGPFHLPLIEHTSSRLTYWSYAVKRATDIAFASLGLAAFGIPFIIKRHLAKEQVQTIAFTDPRNSQTHALIHAGAIDATPSWKDIPLLKHVLKNQISLVGTRPEHPLSAHHFDLKAGVFPFAEADEEEVQNEVNVIRYTRHWNVLKEWKIILEGFAQIIRSFFN